MSSRPQPGEAHTGEQNEPEPPQPVEVRRRRRRRRQNTGSHRLPWQNYNKQILADEKRRVEASFDAELDRAYEETRLTLDDVDLTGVDQLELTVEIVFQAACATELVYEAITSEFDEGWHSRVEDALQRYHGLSPYFKNRQTLLEDKEFSRLIRESAGGLSKSKLQHAMMFAQCVDHYLHEAIEASGNSDLTALLGQHPLLRGANWISFFRELENGREWLYKKISNPNVTHTDLYAEVEDIRSQYEANQDESPPDTEPTEPQPDEEPIENECPPEPVFPTDERAESSTRNNEPHAIVSKTESPPKPPRSQPPDRLPPCEDKAYRSFEYAQSQCETELSDREAHAWLMEHGCDDYTPPQYKTWVRYVRKGRNHHGTQKNHPRGGRSGGSVARPEDI